ncbi:Uncharacterised protein [Salmonella enterica subsp. enterica serovar Bovismorbificans]|uniref:Uncharacterized protein n=1 Tax=Salmonella enterica subsp. enterica serovar Bovismorbificans TaxID=58097 RepID=A0A655BND8_SALET|nr:Uncharacterised protein [Salmonella enterica subsp. enterica serovar Bovismorbificans]
MAKRIEEVALIFVTVEPAQQPAFAVYIRATDVVTGGDIVGA